MKTARIFLILALVIAAFAAGALYARSNWPGVHRCEILPRSSVLELALSDDERPAEYDLIQDQKFLESMGMLQNPDYICNLSELQALATRGGLVSFLAVYGSSSQPRLMLNGVFFRSARQFNDFVKFQAKKNRPVAMLRRAQGDGLWLFIVARDKDAAYSEAEQKQIAAGIRHYQQRMNATILSEAMWKNPEVEAAK